jgi:hypothetical protein
VIENVPGRIAGFVRCEALFGNDNIFIAEPVCNLPEVPAPGVANLDTFGCFGNELGLLVINNNVEHQSDSSARLP